jgi:hypothetical protein
LVYRIKQGGRALLAFAQPVDHALVQQTLSLSQQTVFSRLARSEQLHSLNVLRDVLAQSEHTPPDLAAAALLHDCGKSRYALAIWQKTLAVLVRAFVPTLEQKLSQEDRLTFWRAPFVVRKYHPTWGAQMLRDIDASPRLIWLVAHHADSLEAWPDHPDKLLLARLQKADDAN